MALYLPIYVFFPQNVYPTTDCSTNCKLRSAPYYCNALCKSFPALNNGNSNIQTHEYSIQCRICTTL